MSSWGSKNMDGKNRVSFPCDKCGRSFDRKDLMAQHRIQEHEYVFRCDGYGCHWTFKNRDDMMRHCRSIHSNSVSKQWKAGW